MNKDSLHSFFRFAASSLSCCLVDFTVFQIMLLLTKTRFPVSYIMISTCVAKVFSGSFNYLINKKLVFRNQNSIVFSAWKYLLWSVTQMFLSGSIVSVLYRLTHLSEVLLKCITDTGLFFCSFLIQKLLVFKKA